MKRSGFQSRQSTPISRRSTAKQAEAGALHLVYAGLACTRPRVCTGCGQREGGVIKLSHSHLVPRSYNSSLICEPANIAYHCLDWMGHEGCHSMWESNAKRHALLDFEQNMAFIRGADPAYYGLLEMKTLRPA